MSNKLINILLYKKPFLLLMKGFSFDFPPNIFLDPISYYNIHTVKKFNQELFPVEYGTSFYFSLLNDESTEGFFFKYYSYTLGLCTYRIKEKECYIMTFGILPVYRNAGVGSICINLIEKYAVYTYKIEYIKLHVHVNNTRGIKFYKRNKYKVSDMEEDYYKTLDDKSAYVLIKYMK
jgi:ribosomal protein S18 acetylase RimI-like enzyme